MSLIEGKDGTYYPPFPVLALASHGTDVCMMGGGGGASAAKEVPNVVQAFRYDEATGSLTAIASMSTGKRVVVGLTYSAVANQWLASIDAGCQALSYDIASGEINTLVEWTTETEGKDKSQNLARYSPDGQLIATGGTDGCVRLYSPARTDEEPQLLRTLAKNKEVVDLDFSPDGSILVSVDSGSCFVWDPRTGDQKACINYESAAFKGPGKPLIKSARFVSSDGHLRLLLAASGPRGPSIMGLFGVDGKKFTEVTIDKMPHSSLAVDASGKYAAVCIVSGAKKIYDLRGLRLLKDAKAAHDLPAPCVAFVGQCTAVSGSGDRSINLLCLKARPKAGSQGGNFSFCDCLAWLLTLLVVLFLLAHIGVRAANVGGLQHSHSEF